MADYRIHRPLDRHEGQKTGQVRSVTRGTRVDDVPEGEFSDLVPGRDYSRIDDQSPMGTGTETADGDSEGSSASARSASSNS